MKTIESDFWPITNLTTIVLQLACTNEIKSEREEKKTHKRKLCSVYFCCQPTTMSFTVCIPSYH